jgi:hypothetical protein
MAVCPSCGAPVQHAVREDTGDRVPLEVTAELGPGDDRYVIINFGPPHTVRRVAPSSTAEAYADHRKDCPDYGNGRT